MKYLSHLCTKQIITNYKYLIKHRKYIVLSKREKRVLKEQKSEEISGGNREV
jgi:hypothetical protein